MLQKVIDFFAKLFGVDRKRKAEKEPSSDDIYPMW
jgi:hypothetical protein